MAIACKTRMDVCILTKTLDPALRIGDGELHASSLAQCRLPKLYLTEQCYYTLHTLHGGDMNTASGHVFTSQGIHSSTLITMTTTMMMMMTHAQSQTDTLHN